MISLTWGIFLEWKKTFLKNYLGEKLINARKAFTPRWII